MPDLKWTFTLGAKLFEGEGSKPAMDDKDVIYFKVSYKWG